METQYIKSAEGVKLDPNPDTWGPEVERMLEESYSFVLPHYQGLDLSNIDAARGAGFGRIYLKQGKARATIPVIVHEFKIKPLDVIQTDEGFFPNTEQRAIEHFGGLSLGKATSESDKDKKYRGKGANISSQTVPPPEAWYGNQTGSLGYSGGESGFSYGSAKPEFEGALMKEGSVYLRQRYSDYIKGGCGVADAKARVLAEYREINKCV